MQYGSEKARRLAKILAEDYGINSEEELEKALGDLPKIDIAVFAKPITKIKECVEHDENGTRKSEKSKGCGCRDTGDWRDGSRSPVGAV